MPIQELAYEVCTAFDREGVVVVLVGGGAATFYAPESQQTRDLDFVLHLELFGVSLKSIIETLGFYPSNAAGTFKHDETPFTLEFLRGPLAIGGETLTKYETIPRGDLVLHIISATDSVKDRLAHGAFFADLNAVRQAAQVAKLQPVDLQAVRAWCESEGVMKVYDQFSTFLRG
jgi:hypothetical protein